MTIYLFNGKTDLIRRLPEFLRLPEMKQITYIENSEFDIAKTWTELILRDSFIQTCTNVDNLGLGEKAMSYFEELYELMFSGVPRGTWTFDERRKYCRWAIYLRRCPITEVYFKAFAEWLFKDPLEERFMGWLVVDYENYLLELHTLLYFDDEKIFNAWVDGYFRAVIPANLVFRLRNHRSHEMLHARYAHRELSSYTHNRISNNKED